MGKYDDILRLPHPVFPHRKQFSPADRAAQFAPFAALTGFEDSIGDTAQQREKKIAEDEDGGYEFCYLYE